MNLEKKYIPMLIDMELSLEEKSIRSVPQMCNQIKKIRKIGEPIIFISDTYLPKWFLRKILIEKRIAEESDRIYTSSELRCNKKTGELFKCVKKKVNQVERSVWIHYGDNIDADKKGAKLAGLESVLFKESQLTKREECLASFDPKKRFLLSRVAGSSRLARLKNSGKNDFDRIIRDTGTSVAGPILCGFVSWCIEKAEELNLSKLYFVSRDGEVLIKIANILLPWMNKNIELKYLYGSRRAWILPSIKEIGEKELEWILESSLDIPIDVLLSRVNLKVSDIMPFITKHGFAPSKRSLLKSRRQYLRELFCDHDVVLKILKNANNSKKLTKRYLTQNGFLDGSQIGVVDVGWSGRCLSALREIVGNDYASDLYGLYFSLLRQAGDRNEVNDSAFFFHTVCPEENAWISKCPYAIEIFFSGSHGSVVGYAESSDGIKPKLLSEKNCLGLDWGVLLLQESIVSFAKELVHNISYSEWKKISNSTVLNAMNFFQNPTKEEAEVFGKYPVEIEQSSKVIRPLCEVVKIRNFIKILLKFGGAKDDLWPQGTSTLTSHFYNNIAIFVKKIKFTAFFNCNFLQFIIFFSHIKKFLPINFKKIIIFGASIGGKRAFKILSFFERPIYFADNDVAKQGSRYCGLKVIHPKKLKNLNYDKIYIASTYSLEIYSQLLKMGLDQKRLEIIENEILRN